MAGILILIWMFLVLRFCYRIDKKINGAECQSKVNKSDIDFIRSVLNEKTDTSSAGDH